MEHQAFLAEIQKRALNPKQRADYVDRSARDLPMPAKLSLLDLAESQIGCRFPPIYRELLATVANGGFGPGDGLIGVEGGYTDIFGDTLVKMRERLLDGVEDRAAQRLIPLCDWGDAIFSLLDCTTCRVCTLDARGRFWDTGVSFEDWIARWAAGEDLWDLVESKGRRLR